MKCICGKCSEESMKQKQEEISLLSESERLKLWKESLDKLHKHIDIIEVRKVIDS